MNIVYNYNYQTKETTHSQFEPNHQLVKILFRLDTHKENSPVNLSIQQYQNDVRTILYDADNTMFDENYQVKDSTGYFLFIKTFVSQWLENLPDAIAYLKSIIKNNRNMYIFNKLELHIQYEGASSLFQVVIQCEIYSQNMRTFNIEKRKHYINKILLDVDN